jgi:competence protein ComEC
MSSRDKLFYAVLFGFTIGILVRALTEHIFLPSVLIFFCTIFLLSFIEKKKVRAILLTFIVSFSFCLGALRFVVSIPPPSSLLVHVGEIITLTGMVSDDPDIREFNTKLSIKTKTDTVLATVSHGEYRYGDEVLVRGILEQPENFETETGRTFDYVSYLGKDSIYFLIPKAEVTVLSHGEGNKILTLLFSFKHRILGVFQKVIPDPERSLMSGILLGTKQSLGKETHDALVATGTIHIVALSGYNVSVVAGFFMYLLQNVASRIISIFGGALGIFLFVLMTGASSTAVRAGIMATLVFLAKFWGRPYDAIRILLLTGVIMLTINPKLLVDDISFQLSFLATAGIILIEPIIRKWFSFFTWNWLISLISVTLAAQIAVLPFLVYTMGTFSLISLPINLLILPIVEVVMFLGALTAMVGVILPALAVPIGYFTYFFLHAILFIVEYGSRVPFAAVTVPVFSWIIVLFAYGSMSVWIYTNYKNRVIKNTSLFTKKRTIMFRTILFAHPTDFNVVKAVQQFLADMEIPSEITLKFYPPETENILQDLASAQTPVLLITSGQIDLGQGEMYAGEFAKKAKEVTKDVFVLTYSLSSMHMSISHVGELDAFIERHKVLSYFEKTLELKKKYPGIRAELCLDYQLAEFIKQVTSEVNSMEELHRLIEEKHEGVVFESVKQ